MSPLACRAKLGSQFGHSEADGQLVLEGVGKRHCYPSANLSEERQPKQCFDSSEPVPLYFFDLHNDVDASDPEGQELRDLAAAIAEAIKDARELMGASIKQEGKINLRHYINIRDEHGQVVHTVRFADAVTVLRGRIILNRP